MSVYIKGMAMPKNCFGCDFNMYDCYCKINHGEIDRDFWFCDKTCPIVEVPVPHGRLIDVDKLLRDAPRYVDYPPHYEPKLLSILDVENAPTVIEAEGGENYDEA